MKINMKIKQNLDLVAIFLFAIIIFLSGCLTTKKVINKVKDSANITEALKPYFFEKYPCINDTVTKFIPGKEIIKTDTNTVYIDGEPTVINDTLYIERTKVKTVTNTVTSVDTFIKIVEDKRMINYWRNNADSCHDNLNMANSSISILKAEIKANKAEKNTYKVILIGLLILAALYGYFKLKKKKFTVPNFKQ